MFAVRGTRRIERPANDVVAHAREILDAAASYKNHTVLLKVVPDAWNVRGHFLTVGEADARNFSQVRNSASSALRSSLACTRRDAAGCR